MVRRVVAVVRRHPLITDALVAVVLAAAAVGTAYVFGALTPPNRVATLLFQLGLTLPLAARRKFPLATVAVVCVVYLARWLVVGPAELWAASLALYLALYSAAAHSRARHRYLVIGLAGAAGLAVPVVLELGITQMPLGLRIFIAAGEVARFAVPVLLGAAVRALRDRRHELALRVAELQQERAENARRAVFEERVRIARELHDVVAHHVSLMGVQAGAARLVMATRPQQAADSLGAIESSSRQAVAELHQLLGYLRHEDEPADPAPQPGLDRVPELVASVAGTELAVEGEPRPLPRAVDVSAYRVVQEALTNSRKHSGGAAVRVHLRYLPDAIVVEVLDDGRGLV
ncbi:MAG: sensor histidine kinase, partial [Actinomycetes bacterium]